ncbi:kunitz-type protease inhibitor 1-like [Megalops cyprinoides]|uniref:kunitz-type protease inhibitor 1-like n=1 Tax=Megalops cyprinoides TaxID=118141 RepID=UPI001863A57D|nr:kunitz-type protease inhibitor 1-like [Megalops cyprinoides]
MPPFLIGLVLSASLLLQTGCSVRAQDESSGGSCLDKYRKGRQDFVLDTDESVNEGATFIGSPAVQSESDCVSACCKDATCNLALMEKGEEEGSIQACFLFDCVYRQKYVCRFVKKTGFSNYILNSVFEEYLEGEDHVHDEEDRRPIANGGPDRVVQPGEPVTLNGIESRDDHGISTYQWTQLKGDPSAVMEKTELEDQVMVSNLSPGVYVFQLLVTDTGGQSDTAKVTVLVLTPEQSQSHCLVPKKVGPCRGAFPRWHYNAVTEKCEEFLFGGCRANRNNYLTEQECSSACDGMSVVSSRSAPAPKGEVCEAPCEAGQFSCGGDCCVDAALECDGERHCSSGLDEEACDYLNKTFSRLLEIPVNEQNVRCTEPPKTGPCRASMTRWYYDPIQRKCLRFNYGGCRGNENNFHGHENCMKTCKSVTEKDIFAKGMFERSEMEDSQSGTVAIAVVLAVAILALVAAMGYCYVKRKKEPPRPAVVAASPVSTPEDTERLVYNSTTKPV